MKRLHIHLTVNKLSESIDFYSTFFGTSPTVKHENYANWRLSDPAVHFAISERGQCGHSSGINHLGLQVDTEKELAEIAQRLEKAEITFSEQQGTSCCHAHSNKHWALDPQKIAWESFHSLSEIPIFGEDSESGSEEKSSACCIPLNVSNKSDANLAECCIPNQDDISRCCA